VSKGNLWVKRDVIFENGISFYLLSNKLLSPEINHPTLLDIFHATAPGSLRLAPIEVTIGSWRAWRRCVKKSSSVQSLDFMNTRVFELLTR
jgi:hypothetical protein